MKSLLIKSKLFGDLVISAGDFEESRDIWDILGEAELEQCDTDMLSVNAKEL